MIKIKEVFRDYYFWRVFLHYLDSFIVLSLSNRQNNEIFVSNNAKMKTV